MKSHPSGRGFTLVELLVVVVIALILTAVCLPVARSFIERGHERYCAANLRQIGVATMLYATDNQMTLPVTSHQRRQGGKSWTLTLQPYASGTITFKCPRDPVEARAYTYVLNDFLTPNPAGAPDLDFSRLSKLDQPHRTLLFAEASAAYTGADHFHFTEFRGGAVPPEVFSGQVNVTAHGTGANYLFADGHLETIPSREAFSRLSAMDSRFLDPTSETNP